MGTWERHGIRAFATDGSQLWQRKDLKRVHTLSPAGDGNLVAARLDGRAMQILKAESGETVAAVTGAQGFTQSPNAAFGVVNTSSQILRIDTDAWEVRWRAPFGGDGLAGRVHGIGPDAIAVAGGGGMGGWPPDRSKISWRPSHLVCYDLSGNERWRREFAVKERCGTIWWNGSTREWVGVVGCIDDEVPPRLVRWSPSNGAVTADHPFDDPARDHCLLPGAEYVITDHGEVRDTETGAVVWRFAPVS